MSSYTSCFSNPADAIAANIWAAFLSLVSVLSRAAATFAARYPYDVFDLGTLGADGPVSMLSSDESDYSDELYIVLYCIQVFI